MTSQIDPTIPVYGAPSTESVRRNFAIARTEISALQDQRLLFLPLAGGTLSGKLIIQVPEEPAIEFLETGRAPTEGRNWWLGVIDGNLEIDLNVSGDWQAYAIMMLMRWQDRSVRFGGNVTIEGAADTFLSLRALQRQPTDGGEWRLTIGNASGDLTITTGSTDIAQFGWTDGNALFFGDVEIRGNLTAGNFPRLADLEARIGALEHASSR